jgi:ABC-type multidrug transport system ATPase subunit
LKISLSAAGKKYYRDWIFRNINISFTEQQPTAVLGPNGSGMSTLLQVIAGYVIPNEGAVRYESAGKLVPADEMFGYVSFASPYLELIEEFTLIEIIDLHFKMRLPLGNIKHSEILEIIRLADRSDKEIKYFSSGMKQRLKLGLALLTDSPILLLDEPCSNLDMSAIQWYKEMISRFTHGRIVIVASNENKDEYDFCSSAIKMKDLQ